MKRQILSHGIKYIDIWSVFVHAKLLQSCPTLCNPMGRSPQGSFVQGFSTQEYWTGLSCPPPGDLPDPEMEPASATLQVGSYC